MPCSSTAVPWNESEVFPIKRFFFSRFWPLTVLFLSPFLLFGCHSAGGPVPSPVGSPSVTVENVDALRKVSGQSASVVITAGYHRSGDGCGATYLRDDVRKSAKDNGGSVIVGEDGTRWRAVWQGALPLRLFGAAGDGSRDDTAAIRAWLSALEEGGSGYAAAGTYLFTEPIVFPLKQDISIRGDGPQQTVFLYGGLSTDVDLFLIGNNGNSLHGWTLEGFNLDARTVMTGGAALHLVNMKHTVRLRDVSASRVDGRNGSCLWNGVFLENCSLTHYVGFEIHSQNEGILISGTSDTDGAADILLDQGTVTFTRVGIHCGGGMGGLYVGQVLIYGCGETGYLQDNALAARGNREIFLSELCVLDACHSYCALIDDPLSLQSTVSFNAFISGAGWISPPTPGTGLLIASLPEGRVSIGSQHIKHCVANGIEIRDNTTYVQISPLTYLVGNGGYGLLFSGSGSRIKSEAFSLSNGRG